MGDVVDEIGAIWPLGIPVTHTWRELGCLLWVMQRWKVKAVVEVGVDQGGLAAVLLAHRDMRNYLGVENDMRKVHGSVSPHVIDADAMAPDTVERIGAWIKPYSPALIYCDDGNKPREVALYGTIVRSGDIIGAHDLGIEINEADLPQGIGWVRVTGPWLAGTRQAFFRRI